MQLKKSLALLLTIALAFTAFTCVIEIASRAEEMPPVFSSEKHTAYEISDYGNGIFADGKLTVNDQNNSDWSTQLADNASYFMSMDIKINGLFASVGFRDGDGFIQFQEGGYECVGTNSGWVSKSIENIKTTGAHIILYSAPNSLKVWVNEEKIIDSDLTSSVKGKSAKPGISWTSGGAEITDIKIWTEKSDVSENDEPKYNSDTDKKYEVTDFGDGTYQEGVIFVDKETSSFWQTSLDGNSSYYMSMNISVSGSFVSISYRENSGYIQLQSGGFQNVGGNNVWVSEPISDFNNNARVTLFSSPEKITVWVNGVKIADEDLNGSVAGKSVKPGIIWSDGEVKISNLLIWNDDSESDPTVTDEPKYDSEVHYLYDVRTVTKGEYKDGILLLEPSSSSIFISDLPYNADYYMSLTVKTQENVNIGFRSGESYININQSGFDCVAINGGWTNKKIANLTTGTPITIYSANDRLAVWINNEKVIDSEYTKGGNAQPSVSWSFGSEVTVSNIKIWTDTLFTTDEPFYQSDTDKKIDILEIKNAQKVNDEYLIAPQNSATIITDLPTDADYYMSFIVKTEGAVNISYRDPDGIFNLESSGYSSPGTNIDWVKKQFDLLSFGIRITIHSSPDKISIWVEGEKLIDSPYSKEGECYPGISWSFNNDVSIKNVEIWTDVTNNYEYLGDIENTEIGSVSNESITLPSAAEGPNNVIEDKSEVGTDYVKEDARADFKGIKAQEDKIEAVKDNSIIIVISIATAALCIVTALGFSIFKKKK